MTLIHKRATSKALAANRANALFSTGPRSEEGKLNSRLNSLKHGIFAKALGASIKELGEDPADYASLRQGLLQAFLPEDGFEEMLVEEMAQLSWRRQRLMRAESGIVAAKKRNYEIERALEGTSHAGGLEQFAKGSMVPMQGYAGLPDSVDKCDRIIGALGDLRESVLLLGFKQDNEKFLELVYGRLRHMVGAELKARYRKNRKLARSSKKGLQEVARDGFLAAVDKQIVGYQDLKKLCQTRDLVTTQTMKDAQLLPSVEDLGMILRYEAGLARQFKSKLQQLVGWRRAKKGMVAWDAAEPETQAEEPVPEPERLQEGDPAPCLESRGAG
jgi:hypothetical protein